MSRRAGDLRGNDYPAVAAFSSAGDALNIRIVVKSAAAVSHLSVPQ